MCGFDQEVTSTTTRRIRINGIYYYYYLLSMVHHQHNRRSFIHGRCSPLLHLRPPKYCSLACDNVNPHCAFRKPTKMASLESVNLQVEGERSLRVVIVTWNVGNAQPKLAEIPILLGTKTSLENVDLVVCGSQEAVYNPVPDEDLMEITEEPERTNTNQWMVNKIRRS